jgi:hypothetical protein
MSVKAVPSQTSTVSGVVISGTDELPLVGVSVLVKETANGTITDMDGNFKLNVVSGQTLVFSYIGYVTQEIVVTDQKSLNVILKEDTEILDEVVVVGYGVQKKKLVTGATVQVKGESLAKMNTNSPLQGMQGQTPGVNISSTSGQPGSDMKVSIRGLGTVRGTLRDAAAHRKVQQHGRTKQEASHTGIRGSGIGTVHCHPERE